MAVLTGRGINAAPALLRWMRVTQPWGVGPHSGEIESFGGGHNPTPTPVT